MAQWSTKTFFLFIRVFWAAIEFFCLLRNNYSWTKRDIHIFFCNFHCFFLEIQKSFCHSFMIVFKCLASFEGILIKQGHLSKSARKHFKRLRVVTKWDLIMIVQRISLILGPWSMNNNVIIFLIHLS